MRATSPFSLPLVALGALLWGSDLLLRPGALAGGWSPAEVVLGEHLLLTLVFAPLLWRDRETFRRLNGRQWATLLYVAWGGSALATWLYTKAFLLGPPLPAVLLQKTQPLFALLGAWALLGERRRGAFWVWCALALSGAVLLSGITHLPSPHDLRAEQTLCALGAAALWGGATVGGRRLSSSLTPALLSGGRFALAVPPLVLLALNSPHPAGAGFAGAAAPFGFLALIVLLPDLLGMRLYYAGLRGTTASAATLAELCYPLTALLIGIFVQHAHLTGGQWVGLLVLTVAVVGLSFLPAVAVTTVKPTDGAGIMDILPGW